MKRNLIGKTALALTLTGLLLNQSVPTMASAGEPPEVARTRAWDAIEHTLGGLPESVRKVEHRGSVFYLGDDVTDADFIAVLEVGPEAVRMKPYKDESKLYKYPVYILWNSEKTVLLVHPIIYGYDMILDGVAIPADPPEIPPDAPPVVEKPPVILTEEQEYMLSPEYADAVRAEFYRLLNEHRAAHGLRELEVDLELQDYADIRADEQRILFGHTRPDGSPAGSGWHDSWNVINSRYAENAYTAGVVGTKPERTALGIFSRWKESEGHNRHMLYDFKPNIKMAFGIAPVLDDDGYIISGGIFASGY
jgi:hypothetical protein